MNFNKFIIWMPFVLELLLWKCRWINSDKSVMNSWIHFNRVVNIGHFLVVIWSECYVDISKYVHNQKYDYYFYVFFLARNMNNNYQLNKIFTLTSLNYNKTSSKECSIEWKYPADMTIIRMKPRNQQDFIRLNFVCDAKKSRQRRIFELLSYIFFFVRICFCEQSILYITIWSRNSKNKI